MGYPIDVDAPTVFPNLDSKQAESADRETDARARRALANGDAKTALELLMRAYGDRLFRYASWLLADPPLAEDIVQSAFVELYTTFAKDQGGPFYGWLHRIARHDCLDHLKSPRRRVVSEDQVPEAGEETPLDLLMGHESGVHAEKLLAALRKCIDALPSAQRPIVIMRFFERLTFPEIGTFFREQPATLQARATSALRSLRGCIEAKGHTL